MIKRKTITVELDSFQIDMLRGVMFEYFNENGTTSDFEEEIRLQLEDILADAEDELSNLGV